MSVYVHVLSRTWAQTRRARQSHSGSIIAWSRFSFDDESDDERASFMNYSDIDDDVADKDYVQDAELVKQRVTVKLTNFCLLLRLGE